MKTLKRTILIIITSAILYVVAIYTLEYYLEKQIKKQEHLSYSEFNMTFGGDIAFKNLKFENDTVSIQAESINLNIGIVKIIMSDTIMIDKATVNQVNVTFIKKGIDSTTIDKPIKEKKKRVFALKNVELTGLDFYSIENEDTLTRVIGVDLKAKLKNLKDIQLDQLEKLSFKSMQKKSNILNDILIDHFEYENNTISLDTFKLLTRYSKANYIKHIPEQKGHITLVAYKLIFDSVEFKIQENKLQKISLNEINMDAFELDVYRDKTIPMYTQHEPTYAEILQALDFEVEINALIATKSRISFSMKSDDGKVSRIDLKNINSHLKHINNIPSKQQIMSLTGSFSLSPKSNIGVYMSYNQYSNVENFQLDVHGDNIDTKFLNTMFRPAVNAKLSGVVNNIDVHMVSMGTGRGTVRIQSQDVKLSLFKENGKKSKFISAVGNLLIHKPLDKTGEVNDFEFDQTRPVWNYISHFIAEGIKKAII